jgi:hypothetical protein
MESSSFEFGLSYGWMDCVLLSQNDIDVIELWIKKKLGNEKIQNNIEE